MSTKITYKGHTLAELAGAGKRLKTAGRLMEGDVIIVDDTIDGDPLGYGDNTTSMVGAGQVGYMIVGNDTLIGNVKIGDRLA